MTEKAETPTRPKVLITRLRAVNFRSLADVEVELAPLTVFVGPNASGKSNILDALRFLRDALTTRLQQAVDRRGGMGAIRRWSPKGRPYDVTLEVSLRGEDWQAIYTFSLGSKRQGEFRVKQERCEGRYREHPFAYEIQDGQWKQYPEPHPGMMELVKEFQEDAVEIFRRIVQEVPTNALFLPKAAFLLGIPAYAEIWNAIRDMGFYNLYPNAFREPAKATNPYPLNDEGENLTSTLRALRREHKESYQRIVQFLGAAVPGVEAISVKQTGRYLVAYLHHRTSHAKNLQTEETQRRAAFDLAQESDGTLRLLALFTALFQQPPRTLIGIEEPELNIHPGALAVLRDAMQLASRESQILVTTHSPELLAEFPPEVFRIVEMVDGATQVGLMAEHQREAIRERLFTPGELMVMEGLRREEAHA